ncbi:MAG TPA: DUF4019 domain-containing protein [Allosphingosinicella sp.]|nr:DUF4019 domain-containing protein [Allosphingosinicella sp.]
MSVFAALLIAAAPSAPVVRSEKLEEGRFRITLTAPGLTLEQGQAKAGEEAARLCGGDALLGRYRWRSDEEVGSGTTIALTLEQEAECGKAPPGTVPKPIGFKPTAADERRVLDLTARYFAARDSGRYRDAWNLLTASMQEMEPLADYQARQIDFRARASSGLRRDPVAVTWYDNPPNAPAGGIFAAVDFVGRSSKLQLLCGYLIWLRQPDGSWRLTREEEGSLERGTAPSSPEQLAKAKAAMHCREPG